MTGNPNARNTVRSAAYWNLRLLREDEVNAARELSVACFADRANSADFIRHRYFGKDGPAVDVVVADVDGRLVGSQAVTYLPFQVAGRDEFAGMFTDGMTHPDHRKKGMFRDLLLEAQRQAFARGIAFLFTMPNDESLPAFIKSPDWHVLPDRNLLVRSLSVSKFMRDRGIPGPMASLAGAPLDLMFGNLWAARPDRASQETEFSQLAERVDDLAARVHAQSADVMCKRDVAFLRWRFAENPTWSYRYFITRDTDGRLAAYVITTTERRMGTTVSYVVDMLWDETSPAIAGLLRTVRAALRKDGSALLGAIVASSRQLAALKAAGFREVPARLAPRSFHTAYSVNPDRTDIAAACSRDDAWYLTLADFDTI